MTRRPDDGPEDEREMDEERDAFCRLCDGAPVVRDGLCAKCYEGSLPVLDGEEQLGWVRRNP